MQMKLIVERSLSIMKKIKSSLRSSITTERFLWLGLLKIYVQWKWINAFVCKNGKLALVSENRLIKSEIKCSLCHNFALGYPTFSLARPTNYCYCWAILFDNERIKSSLRSLVTTERLSGLPMTPEHLLVDRN